MFAALAAQQRLDGMIPSDKPSSKQLLPILEDDAKPTSLRALALSLIPAEQLGLDQLRLLAHHKSPEICLEAIRNLQGSGKSEYHKILASIASDADQSALIRAEAIVGLAVDPQVNQGLLETLSRDKETLVAEEAQRALAAAGLVQRSLAPKPNTFDPTEWKAMLNELSGNGNADTGRRLFFHPKLGTCSSCHEMEGRGRLVGPDLSTINRQAGVDAKWLLTHILDPNEIVAPQYLPWQVTTKDGESKVGFVLRKGGAQEVYLGLDGNEYSVPKAQIVHSEELPISLMPPGLLMPLQPSEISDLITYLLEKR
ncbi:MAG: putative heme-binding domain-containing protein [Candidatus Pelagisphaera sp.]|jgi:putative heme-binding domain-containing protein